MARSEIAESAIKNYVPLTDEERENLGKDPELVRIAGEINKTVEDTVAKVAAAQMKVGRLLLDAREKFAGDNEFGKWRKENTCIGSAAHANRLMAISREFHNKKELVAALSTSALMELLPAPPEVIEEVEQQIAEGEIPSVREVRKKVQESNEAEVVEPEPEKEQTEFNNRVGAKPEKVEPAEVTWQRIVDKMGFKNRMDELAKHDYEDEVTAYLMFGLDPLGSIEMSPESLTALAIHYRTECPEEADIVDEAYDIIKETSKRRRS